MPVIAKRASSSPVVVQVNSIPRMAEATKARQVSVTRSPSEDAIGVAKRS